MTLPIERSELTSPCAADVKAYRDSMEVGMLEAKRALYKRYCEKLLARIDCSEGSDPDIQRIVAVLKVLTQRMI